MAKVAETATRARVNITLVLQWGKGIRTPEDVTVKAAVEWNKAGIRNPNMESWRMTFDLYLITPKLGRAELSFCFYRNQGVKLYH